VLGGRTNLTETEKERERKRETEKERLSRELKLGENEGRSKDQWTSELLSLCPPSHSCAFILVRPIFGSLCAIGDMTNAGGVISRASERRSRGPSLLSLKIQPSVLRARPETLALNLPCHRKTW